MKLNAKRRKWLYGVTIAVLALLVALNVLPDEQAPLWLAVAAAVLGIGAPAVALGHVTPDADDTDEED